MLDEVIENQLKQLNLEDGRDYRKNMALYDSNDNIE